MSKKTKAQIIGNVVMFAMAGIIFALILIYGYRQIKVFLERSEDVALATFRNDLANSVESIKRDYGSVTKIELTLPVKYTLACITDPINPGTILPQKHPRMYQAWQTGTENIFLTPPAPQPIKIEDITVDNGYFCATNTGRITLWIQGLGDKAKISQQAPT
ncbi:hypothetical protein HY485_01935 [Candidatus Woesearchaeota archaeon]|nr:hypothetical protein [Candidatus Woesearchaeota archaeon]